MEQLPKIVRERLQNGTKTGVHPDPDLLTAFSEASLPERERLPILEHLSSCADCREVVFLAQPEPGMERVAVAAAMAAPPALSRPGWPGRLILGWATVAACVVIGAVLLHYQTRESRFAQFASKQSVPETNNERQASSTQQFSADAKTQAAAPAPENALTAKLEPSVPLESRPAARADKGRAEKDSAGMALGGLPSPLGEKKFGAVGGGIGSGSAGGALASPAVPHIPHSSEEVTVTSEAPEVAITNAPPADLPLQARSSATKVTSQDFAAAAPPPAVQAQKQPSAPASANAASPQTGAALDSVGGFAGQQASLEMAQAKAMRKKQELARVSSNYIPTRWTISSDGSTLLRSTDEGSSWIPVSVANNLVLRAVAALGPEVWAGGKSGALYHSSDLGMHWTQVKPTANGIALAADIVSIDFPDPERGKLTTSEGKVWTTVDGGKSWQAR
jgi:photosystem II stability/assembly factor-like uncharacterized protein